MAEKEKELTPAEEIKKLKEEAQVKSNKDPIEHILVYDSFGETLERVYYWLLDFIRDPAHGAGYKVEKTADYFAAAEASGYYGEMGSRRTAIEKRATELMGTINLVVKSIMNLLWDLRVLDLRLESYKQLKEGAEEEKAVADEALKAIWLTEVDMGKGRAAINILTTEMGFSTLRDAFMACRTVADAKKVDVNDRVRRILVPRVAEYLKWVELSGKELKKRYVVEKAYLKSQVNTLRLYTRWVKPYLVATNKLMPPGEMPEPEEIVTAFDVMRIDVTLFGTKEIKKPVEIKDESKKVYSCVEVEFRYRASPGMVERGHYTARGKVSVYFRPYVFQKHQLDELKKKEDEQVLRFVEGMTDESLKVMQEDIDKYLKEEKEEKKKEKKPMIEFKELPIIKETIAVAEGLKKAGEKVSTTLGKVKIKAPKKEEWDIARVKKEATKTAEKDVWFIFEKYKKSRKMLTW